MNINNKIKELRKSKGYTLEMLAEKTGFTKGYLSKIERSSKVPPFATIQTIGNALEIEIKNMLESKTNHDGTKNIEIVKNAIGQDEFLGSENDSVYSFIPLLRAYNNRYMRPFITKIYKGATETLSHDSEEFVYVMNGTLELKYEDKIYLLSSGDCFYLDSRLGHSFYNENDEPVMLLTVFFDYRRF